MITNCERSIKICTGTCKSARITYSSSGSAKTVHSN